MLQTVHSETYLKQLKQPRFVARALELDSLGFLPIDMLDRCVLEPMRLATMGTVIAARIALSSGIAINLSGGYHHASGDRGEGFCVYSDIAIAVAMLRQSQKITPEDSIIIIDLDAHQGNGLERIFYHDPKVQILDMYNHEIYPHDLWATERIDCHLPLTSGIRDRAYLDELKAHLPQFLQQVSQPKIAFYNAGTDIYENDPLGRLKISHQGVLERDRFVFKTLVEAGIPVVMVPSGGYTRESYQLIADSVGEVLQTWA
jgi:histone deacetylase 11